MAMHSEVFVRFDVAKAKNTMAITCFGDFVPQVTDRVCGQRCWPVL